MRRTKASRKILGSSSFFHGTPMSMVPMTIMERGVVTASVLAMAVSKNSGTGNPVILRAMPRNTVTIQGFRRMFLHFVLKSAVVNMARPAVHIKMRLGMIKMDAANRPSLPYTADTMGIPKNPELLTRVQY